MMKVSGLFHQSMFTDRYLEHVFTVYSNVS